MKLRRLILLSLLMPAFLLAQSPESELNELIQNGKQEIYHFHMDRALQIFKTAQQKFPGYPHGYFYEAYLTTILFSQDKTNSRLDSLLHATVDRSIKVGERYKERSKNSAESLYYLGVSHGIMGIYHVLNRNYLSGYIHGRKGKKYLEEVVSLNPTYYDAYLGLGIFHYYVDLLPGMIQFFAKILGFEGDRHRGMREIQLTAENGTFFRLEARFAYSIIRYFLEGEKQQSVETFRQLEAAYPDNPAIVLLLGYHHRRQGQILQAISYFSRVPDTFTELLPQITVVKYYNLAVCYYRLNEFSESEKYFNILSDSKLRKSRYYYAALAYYKGHLEDLKFNRKSAVKYYEIIQDNKEMQYWYHLSKMYRDYPMDSLGRAYVIAKNDVFTFDREDAERKVLMLKLESGKKLFHPGIPYLAVLIYDLQARFEFRKGNFEAAADIYQTIIGKVDDIPDNFRKAWIYIYYAQVLRKMESWDRAEEMLKRAETSDDQYTKIIIEREKFILKHDRQKSRS